MAKSNTKFSFSKAYVSLEDGDYILTEITKDAEKSYNLSAILDSLVGSSDEVSVSVEVNSDIPALEE